LGGGWITVGVTILSQVTRGERDIQHSENKKHKKDDTPQFRCKGRCLGVFWGYLVDKMSPRNFGRGKKKRSRFGDPREVGVFH